MRGPVLGMDHADAKRQRQRERPDMQIVAREIDGRQRIDDRDAETLAHATAYGRRARRFDQKTARDAGSRGWRVDLEPVGIVGGEADKWLIREILQGDYAFGEQWMAVGQHAHFIDCEQWRQTR